MDQNGDALSPESPDLESRHAPLELDPNTFRALGHRLVDRLADFLGTLPQRPVTTGEPPEALRALLDSGPMPEHGADPERLLDETASLLLEHSLFNGHPRFLGFITSSAAPIGALADLLAATVNPNVGGWILSPIATEIEAQTIRWIADLLDYPRDCGGLLVSGGNAANFIGVLAARRAKAGWDVRTEGTGGPTGNRLRLYTSAETHTWVQKAADLFGLGTDSIRWIPVDEQLRMDPAALRRAIVEDAARGDRPFLVVGTAGTVSTGAVDPIEDLAAVCREHGLWLHVDGAYGALAAVLPDAPRDLKLLALADSLAVDPHKWLYAPLEAGCALVRDARALRDAFSYHPVYYHMARAGAEEPLNYHEYGPQNSRGFRALKVWLGLRQAGREGYRRMIADDVRLARALYDAASCHPRLQAFTQGLSITTFRYAPEDLRTGEVGAEEYLNTLNAELLDRVQRGGEAFLSNAVVGGRFLLRACVVNFRTSLEDVRSLPLLIDRVGSEVNATLRPRSP